MALDNVTAGIRTTSELAPGASVSGSIDSQGDQDWYRTSLIAGRVYRFDLQGLDSDNGSLEDPVPLRPVEAVALPGKAEPVNLFAIEPEGGLDKAS